jgi:hypothetical protein
VVVENVIFGNREIKIKNVEKFSLDSADVTFAEDAGAKCPVNIFECGII